MEKRAWRSNAQTSVGTIRKLNEDSFLDAPLKALWCVADGMGGHAKGNVASQEITEALKSHCEANKSLSSEILKKRLSEVNARLISMGQTLSEPAIIGSTVAALFFENRCANVMWAGDSRVYRFRQQTLTLLSQDHSKVQELIQAGLLFAEDAQHHPQGNIVTRAVGTAKELNLETVSYPIVQGDIYILCTDGLNNSVTDDEIAEVVRSSPFDQLADGLVEKALRQSARDNVTVVAVYCTENPQALS